MGAVRDNYSDMSAQYRPDRRFDDNYSDMSAQYRPDRRFDDNYSDMSESLRSGPKQGLPRR